MPGKGRRGKPLGNRRKRVQAFCRRQKAGPKSRTLR
ncbi:hypothetical protein CLS_23670 [[Clostridium] cf. saccharolyticum K10]|nr:hypothetical protein CLS_23670 [[Clostridium] cf. saccharolyticum K10]